MQNCEGSRELEEQCASYCFKAVRPFMDYVKVLQKKVEEADEPITQRFDSRFDKLDSFLAKQNSTTLAKLESIEKKLKEGIPKVSPINLAVGKYKKIGDKYYYIEKNLKVNWFVAGNICRTMGSHLVSFQSPYEFNAVIDYLHPKIDYWIDLNDLGAEGQFRSIVTGFKPQFDNWHSGEPNDSRLGEHCCDLWYKNEQHLMTLIAWT